MRQIGRIDSRTMILHGDNHFSPIVSRGRCDPQPFPGDRILEGILHQISDGTLQCAHIGQNARKVLFDVLLDRPAAFFECLPVIRQQLL